jgi:glycolate oxidase FAD binding subunit
MTLFKPADAPALREVVAWAAAEEQPLEIVGSGSKQSVGRPLQVAHTLDLSALSGIVAYEPSELVLTTRAATP